MNPRFSILLAIYNQEKFIEQCLDSILAQTYTDFEVVCVDDGSTDTTPQILADYAKRDERIRIITQKNAGTMLARKRGVMAAKGDFSIIIDPDDWIEPEACETLALTVAGTDADIIQFSTNVVRDQGKVQKGMRSGMTRFLNGGARIINDRDTMLKGLFVDYDLACNLNIKCFETELLRKTYNMIPDFRVTFFEDFLTSFFIALNFRKLIHISDKLYNYRLGSGESTISRLTPGHIDRLISSQDMVLYTKKYTEEHLSEDDYAYQLAHNDIIDYALRYDLNLAFRRLPEGYKTENVIRRLEKFYSREEMERTLIRRVQEMHTKERRRYRRLIRIIIALGIALIAAIGCLFV